MSRPSPSRSAHYEPYILMLMLCLLVGGAWIGRAWDSLWSAGLSVQPAVDSAAVDKRVDPNKASWASLARLPGIGETLAKRIVAYRTARQHGTLAFTSPEDLPKVRGIGPKLLRRIKDYLKFPRYPPHK